MTPLYRIYDKRNKKYQENPMAGGNNSSIIFHDHSYYIYWDYEDEDYVIERCTGVKDVNGVYMYEGDIVTFGHDYKDIKYSLILEGMQRKISDGNNLKFATDGKDLEVVGNIHN